jgi:hypothetical protein
MASVAKWFGPQQQREVRSGENGQRYEIWPISSLDLIGRPAQLLATSRAVAVGHRL